ncbi:MAG TPA: hypothetical protein VHL30_03375, partial [Chlamydiales bacterium]|nr:hypothetical protein [Chlamydiales bacterium]
MKKMWWLSPFILSMLSSPLFGEDSPAKTTVNTSEIASSYVFSQHQKNWRDSQDKKCTSCCDP